MPLYLILFGVLGLLLGSFATAIIYRTKNNISYIADSGVAARSQCTDCGTVLKVIDLFPVFSWLISKGKCRYCKTSIPVFYPVTESATALCAVGMFLVFNNIIITLIWMAQLPFLYALIYLYFTENKVYLALFYQWLLVFVISLCLTLFLGI